MSEGANQLKTSRTMVKPLLVHSPWQCASTHFFFSAATFVWEEHGYGPPHSLLAYFGPLWFLLVSENEIAAKGITTDCPTCNSKMSVPPVLPLGAEMLDPLHKLRRGLLWRWQLITKASIYFFTDSVRENLIRPCIIWVMDRING
jgi:hypothetical protein